MSTSEISALLRGWREGQAGADEALFAHVYAELRRLAGGKLRYERADHTLQPTALVHEVWVRLVGHEGIDWQGRAHFFGIAARLMRQILIDHARAYRAARRQGGVRVDLSGALDGEVQVQDSLVDILAVHEALERLASFDERRAKVLELRFFGGLERKEISEVLGVSERIVKRDIVVAQAWLRRELVSSAASAADPPEEV